MSMGGGVVLVFTFIVVPLAQAAVYIGVQPFADAPDMLDFAGAVVAYHWLLNNVVLGLKLPVFQKSLPYDQRVRWHIGSTAGLVVFLGWHGVYTIFLKAKFIDLTAWSLLGLFGVIVFSGVVWVPLPGLRKTGVRRSYDRLKTVHQGLYLALGTLTFVHILQAQVLDLVPPVSAWGYLIWFGTAVLVFLATRIRGFLLPSCPITSVQVSGETTRITLGVPRGFSYQAGQFAFLRFGVGGWGTGTHPFSFASAPHEAEIGFAIRGRGDLTRRLTELKPGDRVRLDGAFGAFGPGIGADAVALVGSGIGIVPLVSILKDLAHRSPCQETVCFFSVDTQDFTNVSSSTVPITKTMSNLNLKLLIHQNDNELASLVSLLSGLEEPRKYQYYLCSSAEIRKAVTRNLIAQGVPGHQIHREAFNLG